MSLERFSQGIKEQGQNEKTDRFDPDKPIEPYKEKAATESDKGNENKYDPDVPIDLDSDTNMSETHDDKTSGFDPDEPIDFESGKNETERGQFESNEKDLAQDVDPLDNEERIPYDERLRYTPKDGDRGTWTGKRGDSEYVPNKNNPEGAKVSEKLGEYGKKGIEYKGGDPNFTDVSEASVKIEMTENRLGGGDNNYLKADTKYAEEWNNNAKDGRTDWTARDVKIYRQKNHLTWHECSDCKTCQLVPTIIHRYFGHSGGVAECSYRNTGKSGGGFDA